MTLIEFALEDAASQKEILKTQGVFLAYRMKGKTKILLYKIDTFYIELFYDKYEYKHIPLRILRAFEEIDHLDPYLKKIRIKNITGNTIL
ncbi:MAG: hypothetical protein ABIN97_08905 [Ginsengibacter sp.]